MPCARCSVDFKWLKNKRGFEKKSSHSKINHSDKTPSIILKDKFDITFSPDRNFAGIVVLPHRLSAM